MKISIVVAVLILAGSFYYFKQIAHHALYPAPRWVVPSNPPPSFQERTLPLSDGSTASAWLWKIEAENPGIVFFHGNGENLETMRMSGLLERIGELGRSFIAVDYPGYGKGTGTPCESNIVEAGVKAADLLLQETSSTRVIVAGWSLGAAVAAQVGAAIPKKTAAVVLLSPWASLLETAGEFYPAALVRMLIGDRFDTYRVASRIQSPVLVIHGKQDELIRVEQSEKLLHVFGTERARRIVVEDAGHNDLLGRDQVWRETARFLLERAG